MSLDAFNSLIKELETTMGLSGMEQESGYCRFEVDNGLILNFQYRPEADSLYIFCEVGGVPQTDAETYCQELLAANLTGAQSGCGMFALERETMTVLLTLETPLSAVNADNFRKRLDCMTLHAGRYQAKLSAADLPGSDSCAASGQE